MKSLKWFLILMGVYYGNSYTMQEDQQLLDFNKSVKTANEKILVIRVFTSTGFVKVPSGEFNAIIKARYKIYDPAIKNDVESSLQIIDKQKNLS